MTARRTDPIGDAVAQYVSLDRRSVRLNDTLDQARLRARVLAETDNVGDARLCRAPLQPGEVRIVPVEDGGAARLEPEKDLGLGVGDFGDAVEELEMHRRDGRHDCDMRADQPRQRRDLAGVVHADLEHAIARGLAACGQATAARPSDC